MESFLTASMACICLPLYMFTFANGLRHIANREAVVTRWQVFNLRITHLTGAAAVIYGIVQLVSGGIVFIGLFNAVVNADLLLGIASVIAGFVVGWVGTTVVRSLNQGVEEYNSAERAAEAFNYVDQTSNGITIIYRQFGIGGTQADSGDDTGQQVIVPGESDKSRRTKTHFDDNIIEDADYRAIDDNEQNEDNT